MSKVKFTKGELKRQRDLLEQYKKYLPILQLKKQQLQIELQQENQLLRDKLNLLKEKQASIVKWIGLIEVSKLNIKPWIKPQKVNLTYKNIAGVEVPLFLNVEYSFLEYDLFLYPVWFEKAVDALRELINLIEEINCINTAIDILREQLRITVQRVNLFEKVKIPQTEEIIRQIKVYLGDLFTAEVCRSKIAKRKIQKVSVEN